MITLPLAIALSLVLATTSLLAQAQPAQRDTEALRRLQRNLQQAQQERDVAVAEKAALQRELSALQARQQAEGTGQARLQAELRQLRAASEAERAQLAELRLQLQQARASAEQAQQTQATAAAQATRERASLQAELQGRTQANQAVVAQLAASTARVADLRQRNERLHAIGLELLDELRGAEGPARWWRGEPLLGLASVRAENRAEAARQRLDALRAPAGAATPPPPAP